MSFNVLMLGKENCSFCVRAKALLEQNEIEYEYVDISVDDEVRENFVSNGYRTVPQIFLIEEDFTGVTKTHIGGYTDLASFIETM